MIQKIISGGQTGVDRAALDVALEMGIPCGGWCPKGRIAEDGMILPLYPLEETSSTKYRQRTEWNVRDTDATLILTEGDPSEGTALTIDFAHKHEKPCLVIDFLKEPSANKVLDWAKENQIDILNIAGPRESKKPNIYNLTKDFLHQVFINM